VFKSFFNFNNRIFTNHSPPLSILNVVTRHMTDFDDSRNIFKKIRLKIFVCIWFFRSRHSFKNVWRNVENILPLAKSWKLRYLATSSTAFRLQFCTCSTVHSSEKQKPWLQMSFMESPLRQDSELVSTKYCSCSIKSQNKIKTNYLET